MYTIINKVVLSCACVHPSVRVCVLCVDLSLLLLIIVTNNHGKYCYTLLCFYFKQNETAKQE